MIRVGLTGIGLRTDRVGICEAKARLSDLVERAARGTEVTITRHCKAIAKLVPARSGGTPDRK